MTDPSKWVYDSSNDCKPFRHEAERVRQGFSVYDWWNFNDYLTFVTIGGLEKFKTGAGYPHELGSMEEWVKTLDKMIEGFKAKQELHVGDTLEKHDAESVRKWREPLEAKWKIGSDLFIKYYGSLWD